MKKRARPGQTLIAQNAYQCDPLPRWDYLVCNLHSENNFCDLGTSGGRFQSGCVLMPGSVVFCSIIYRRQSHAIWKYGKDPVYLTVRQIFLLS
jgi:hypothetical protein